jgi:hypothetical protein
LRRIVGSFEAIPRRLGKYVVEAWLIELQVFHHDRCFVEGANDFGNPFRATA